MFGKACVLILSAVALVPLFLFAMPHSSQPATPAPERVAKRRQPPSQSRAQAGEAGNEHGAASPAALARLPYEPQPGAEETASPEAGASLSGYNLMYSGSVAPPSESGVPRNDVAALSLGPTQTSQQAGRGGADRTSPVLFNPAPASGSGQAAPTRTPGSNPAHADRLPYQPHGSLHHHKSGFMGGRGGTFRDPSIAHELLGVSSPLMDVLASPQNSPAFLAIAGRKKATPKRSALALGGSTAIADGFLSGELDHMSDRKSVV